MSAPALTVAARPLGARTVRATRPPRPTVTVVLPALQERAHIRDCLDSLLAQDYECIVEIVVVDGGSDDGTREIVAGFGERVALLDNPRVSAAAALNIGWQHARGEVICRADAHARYAPDYVRRCVELLVETGAANVGGPMRPVATTPFGRAVAAVTASPLGVGPGRFHYSRRREDVDTVYLGCWWRDTLAELQGWDETSLQWAAEDHELNFRLLREGRRVVLDPTIRSVYFPREHWRSLARQYANYGTGKVSTLRKHRALPTWRPLVPAALVAAMGMGVVGAGLARRPAAALALPLAYAGGVTAAAAWVPHGDGVGVHRVAGAAATCHLAYGIGFWRGVVRAVSGRGFDARPRNGRRT